MKKLFTSSNKKGKVIQSTPKKIVELLKSMVPIVLGILIALFINNWSEQRSDKRYIDKMLNSIGEELKENRSELTVKIAEHKRFLDTIDHYIEEEVTIGHYLNKMNGLRSVSIKNAAAKTLVNSRIELLDYKDISVLSSIVQYCPVMKSKMKIWFLG